MSYNSLVGRVAGVGGKGAGVGGGRVWLGEGLPNSNVGCQGEGFCREILHASLTHKY